MFCKKKNVFFTITAALLTSVFFSCNMELVSEPTATQITGSQKNTKGSLLAPESLTASQGGIKTVTLQWKSASNAVQYYVYSAETAFDTFERIAETKGNATEITITLESGKNAYYSVTTIDSDGNESQASKKVLGSTMGTPVITQIENDEDGTGSTVSWWMPNCTEKTYLSVVNYTACCYSEDKKTIVQEKHVTGSTQSVHFTGLEPKTSYFYQIEAFTQSDQTNVEVSDMVDWETAHRVIPAAPENLSITKGISAGEIKIKWTLPDYVDTRVAANSYEQHPVWFKIERKLLEEDDSLYQTIVDYIGTIRDDENTSEDTVIKIALDESDPANQTSSTNLTAVIAENAAVNPNYSSYVPGTILTYTDKNAERGKQYSYRVQSFTDDTNSIISSSTSLAEDSGWLIGNLSLKTNAVYEESEDKSQFTKINVNFTCNFDDQGLTSAYTYMLTMARTKFDDSKDDEKLIRRSESLSAINSYVESFTGEDIKNNEGYLRYTLYITPFGSDTIPKFEGTELNTYYLKTTSPNAITVTGDANKIPVINNFEIDDGYAEKFILSWDYDEHCQYSLSWIDFDENGNRINEDEEHTLTLDDSALVKDNVSEPTRVSYTHTAASGESRQYTLTANNGLSTDKIYSDGEENPKTVRTLGTADINFDTETIDYSTIKVTWKKVQYAKYGTSDFVLSAHYADSADELLNTNDESDLENNPINTRVDYDDESESYTATITNPSGYDDALLSGKDIVLSVKATSSRHDGNDGHDEESTTATKTVRTLGPALTQTSIASPQDNTITLVWEKVEGAKGYLIHRLRYTDGSATSFATQEDSYYCDGSKLLINGEEVSSARAQLRTNGNQLILDDSYAEQEDNKSSYELNQSMISWGLPFGYEVIPVKDSGDFAFSGKNIDEASSTVKIAYRNLSDVKGATFGYGLKVRASKAESATNQKVEWRQPYYKTYTPTLYYRDAGSEKNIWTKLDSTEADKTAINPTPVSATKAYEYVIAYNKSASTISLPQSFIKDANTKVALGTLEEDGVNYDYTKALTHDGAVIEKLNKGYLLAVNFGAGYGGTKQDDGSYANDDKYYSERVNWDEWNYAERSIGPDKAYVSILNYNLSSSWTKVFNLDENLHYANSESVTNTKIWKSGEVSAYLAPQALPTTDSVTNGSMMNTNGPLMVLRDAKHYYTLTLEKGTNTAEIGKDKNIYAYRQINDVELVRATSLILSNIIKQTGINGNYGTGKDFGSEDQVVGTTGTFQWGSDTGSNLKWQLNNFTYYFTEIPGKSDSGIDSFIKIEDTNTSKSNRGAKQSSTLKHISACGENSKWNIIGYPDFSITGLIPITVTSVNIPLESYSGTVGLAAKNDQFSATVKHNSTQTFATGTVSGSDSVKRWCPAPLDGNGYNGTNSTYGWWN